MSQHFLLSPSARGEKSFLDVARLSDEEAYSLLCELKWGKDGTQCCPKCGVVKKHYSIKGRRQYKCTVCNHTFSVTSGTKFAFHKKSFRDILMATGLFAKSVKGLAALSVSRDMGVAYKPILLFNHKLREALYETRNLSPFEGEAEIDGCYFHYYIRPANFKKNRIDRRLARNLNPNKRCVLAMRQRGEPGKGANRTIISVIKTENERDVLSLAKKYIKPNSAIFTDSHTCYTSLATNYTLKQINHDEAYSDLDGVNENQAESFFARLRKLFSNIHKCDPKFLGLYANEMAWREDNRRKSFYDQFVEILNKCLHTGQSKLWSKYWQGKRVTDDCLLVGY